MTKQTDSLKQLARAKARRDQAEQEYTEALLAAVEEHGYGEAARAVGLSRQAVRQRVLSERSR